VWEQLRLLCGNALLFWFRGGSISDAWPSLAVETVCDLVALGRLWVVVVGRLLLLAAAGPARSIGRGLARLTRRERGRRRLGVRGRRLRGPGSRGFLASSVSYIGPAERRKGAVTYPHEGARAPAEYPVRLADLGLASRRRAC
jgi:hypothetical protein